MAAFAAGDIVDTMYGRCKVEGPHGSLFKARPLTWKLAQGQAPTYHVNAESMTKVVFKAGTEVRVPYGGLGKIQEVREVAGVKHFIVLLKNWKLAQGQSPTLYLDPASVTY